MILKTAIAIGVCISMKADAFISNPPASNSMELLSSATSITTPFHNRRKVSSSLDIALLDPIGNGTFGGVYWSEDRVTGQQLVAKTARAVSPDKKAQRNANSYLELEAYVNSKLCQSKHDIIYQQHIAPYLGEITINRTMWLIWEASGEYTLEDYIEMDNGWVQLAKDLGIQQNSEEDRKVLHRRFAREVLRQLLEGLAYCHSMGVIHRDIKPANVLVDPTSKTLRLIDFGSACDMSSWTTKAGYRGQNKGPRSILYCAPEEFVNEEQPYAFDMYGAAITWLRTVLSDNKPIDVEDDILTQQSAFGLGDEEQLFQWRLAVRDFSHSLVSWEEYAVLHNTLPYGWSSLFGSSREGINALRLLSNLLSYSPANRISASEALLGSYLNSDCSAAVPPELPPAMPWSLMSHVERWKKEREVDYQECRLDDLFTEVVAVELAWPLGCVLGRKNNAKGAVVTGVEDGENGDKLSVCEGDSLLAIGPIDVENAAFEHIIEILDQWPRKNPVPLLFLRDSA